MIAIVVPRTLVVIVFLTDIFYFQYLHYFYKSLILLGIPLITHFLIFLVGYLCEETILYTREYVNISQEDNFIVFKYKETPTIAEDIVKEKSEKRLKYLSEEWDIVTIMHTGFALEIYQLYDKYKKHIILFTYTEYFIGWTYYLSVHFLFISCQVKYLLS